MANTQEHVLSHQLMEAQLVLTRNDVPADVRVVIESCVKAVQRELALLRMNNN